MKKYLFLLAVACGPFVLMAQSDGERNPYEVKSLTNDGIQTVEVKTSGGSILVKGVSAADARIEVFVRNNNNRELSKEEIKQRLEEDYELTISVTNHKLTAIARAKRNISDWRKSLNVAFKIYVPQNVSTDLSTSGGSIALRNLAGNQKFSTSGGSIDVDHLSGKTVGSTSGGSINLSNSTDEIDLTTSGGSIEANNCSGNIRLETSGGSLQLHGLKGVIRAGTSGGSAEGDAISGELSIHTSGSGIKLTNLSCSLDASTSGSDIEVSMASLGKYIKLSNSGGDIDLTLPQGKGVDLTLDARKIRTVALSNFSGRQEQGHMKGTLNGGGIPVTIDAGGGEISLLMQ